ncbi:MAG: peptidylprolyl isomerase [Candidatus Binataceae bacterium]
MDEAELAQDKDLDQAENPAPRPPIVSAMKLTDGCRVGQASGAQLRAESPLGYDWAAMLDLMRRHAYSWVTRTVLILIIIVFGFWGVGSGLFSQVHPVATVDGNRVLAVEVDKESEQLQQILQQMYGANAGAVMKNINLRQEALDRIIENRLIATEARHLGLHVSDAELQQKIATQPGFQSNGQFDFQQYQDVLRQRGMLPAEFESTMRTEMTQDTLEQMVDAGVQASDREIRHAFNLRYQKIGLAYIEFPWTNFTAAINPTDQQIGDFYKAHAEDFREPERVQIMLIHYEPLTLAAKYTPSDKEIEDYYKTNLASHFTHPDTVHARHILIAVPEGASDQQKAAAKVKAEDILKQAQSKGGNFDKLAAKYSDDPSNKDHGGDLGSFGRGQMIKPFEDAVFSMKPAEIRIVQTKFGYHVVKLDAFTPAHTDTLAEARPKIISGLREQTGTRLARDAIDQDLTAALGGADLPDLAKKRGIDAVTPPPFAKGEPIAGIGMDSKVTDAALALDKGQVRAVPEENAPYLIKLLDKTPAHIPPLKDISAAVRQAYIRSYAEIAAHAQAEKLIAQIKLPTDMQRLAAANKLTLHNVDPFERASHTISGIGQFPEVTDAAGDVPSVPGLIHHVMEQDGNAFIFEVTSRADPDDEQWASAKEAFSQDYLSHRRAEVWSAFLDQLRAQSNIVIHADQLGASGE